MSTTPPREESEMTTNIERAAATIREAFNAMSDFTIEQLEALKAGTTPGPWDEDVIYPDCSYIVDDTGGRDAALAFTAPALVDALIAEKRAHQELRAEVERLRDDYRTRPYPYGEVARTLTSILEADHG